MLQVFGIAVAAACAVAAYGWLSNRDPEAAKRTARAIRQLVTVVAVLARAVDGVLDVLGDTWTATKWDVRWEGQRESFEDHGTEEV